MNKICFLFLLSIYACSSNKSPHDTEEVKYVFALPQPAFKNSIKSILEETILFEVTNGDTTMMYTQNMEVFNYDQKRNLISVDGIDISSGTYDTIKGLVQFNYESSGNHYQLVEEEIVIGTFAWINNYKVLLEDLVLPPVMIYEYDEYGNNLAVLSSPAVTDSIYQYTRISPISYYENGLIKVGQELSRSITLKEFSQLNFDITSPNFDLLPKPKREPISTLKKYTYTYY